MQDNATISKGGKYRSQSAYMFKMALPPQKKRYNSKQYLNIYTVTTHC